MVNPPSLVSPIHAHAPSLEAVCFFGTTWSVLYVLCNLDVRLLLHRVEHMPGDEDVTCRGSLFAHAFFRGTPGSLLRPNVSRPLWVSMSDDGQTSLRWAAPEYYPLLPSSCRSKLETLVGLGGLGLAAWWLHCLAPRSPLTAYCIARAHADGLTAAPSLAYPILHGATLEGGACGGGRADGSAGLTERLSLAQPFCLQYSSEIFLSPLKPLN